MKITTENIKEYLLKHNIKPSYSRIHILEYLLVNKNHPTPDEIYRELVKGIPTLSKTTVYNTLGIFADNKIAKVVTIEDNATRYDADVSNHGHFKCKSCGVVYDFYFSEEDIKVKGLEKFEIHDKDVYYRGICFKCLKNKK